MVFNPIGTVTAGNSSAISDGAAAVLMMSKEKADERGLKPLARFGPSPAPDVTHRSWALVSARYGESTEAAGLTLDDIDYIELNEAFAAQSLAVINEMKLGKRMDRINVKGGAIALGHPLGCSGTRITGAVAHILQEKDAQFGLATMCIGLGQGVSTVLERI